MNPHTIFNDHYRLISKRIREPYNRLMIVLVTKLQGLSQMNESPPM